MSEAKVTAGRLSIHWGNGRYTVDVPEFDGGTVVSAEVADEMLKALNGAMVLIDAFGIRPDFPPLVAVFDSRRSAVIAAINKATGAA